MTSVSPRFPLHVTQWEGHISGMKQKKAVVPGKKSECWSYYCAAHHAGLGLSFDGLLQGLLDATMLEVLEENGGGLIACNDVRPQMIQDKHGINLNKSFRNWKHTTPQARPALRMPSFTPLAATKAKGKKCPEPQLRKVYSTQALGYHVYQV